MSLLRTPVDMKQLIAFLLLIPFISSCKYGSMMEAENACAIWEQERKGVFEVDCDGDGRQGADITYLDGSPMYRVDGELVETRECTKEESTKQIIGKEFVTPWKILMTEVEFKALKIVYKKFPY